jgi:hypothetical protein
MRSAVALAAGLFLCGAASAQVQAYASLDPPIVPFHKSAVLTLVVEAPTGTEVTIPDMRDYLGDLPVKGTPSHKQEMIGEDRVRTTEQYTLDPIQIRSYFIRPVELTWSDGSLLVPVPAFRARDLTPDELAEAGKFVAQLPGGPGVNTGTRRPAWQWIALACAVVALAVVAWLLLRRKRVVREPERIKTPWEVARERLKLLEARHLPQQAKFDAYYVDLSSILRYYIEGRFQLHAPERTTPEFLAETAGQNYFSPDQEVFLSRFLRLCDRVKFARFRPDLEETARSFEEVARFVEDTVPQEPGEVEPGEAAAA